MKKKIIAVLIATIYFFEATAYFSSYARYINQPAIQRALYNRNLLTNTQPFEPLISRSHPAGIPRVYKMRAIASQPIPAELKNSAVLSATYRAPQSLYKENVQLITPLQLGLMRIAQPIGSATQAQVGQSERIFDHLNMFAQNAQKQNLAQFIVPSKTQARSTAPITQSFTQMSASLAKPTLPIQRTFDNIKIYAASNKLIKAAQKGNINETIKLIQTSGVNINYQAPADPGSVRPNAGGNTPLHEAVKKLREQGTNAYATIARLLINDPRIDVSARNDMKATPLLMLAGGTLTLKNSQQPKQGIVQNNEEVYRPDLADIAQALIQKGANVNAQDINNRTALYWATNNGYFELAQTLINNGADPNTQDIHGRTPLMKAAQKGYLRLLQLLIDAGANPNLQDFNKGRTALHWVQRMREGSIIKSGNQMTKERALDAIRILLNAGANPALKDKITSDNSIARSSIYWAQQKSPWPINDNKELKLLMSYANSCTMPSTNTTSKAYASAQPAYAYK